MKETSAIVVFLGIGQGNPEVIQHCLICIQHGSISAQHMDIGGNGADHQAQIALARLQSLFRPFTVLDVGACAVPPEDLIGFIAEWFRAEEEPPINSVIAANTGLELAWFS